MTKQITITEDQKDLIDTIVNFSKTSQKEYAASKEWTVLPAHSCETIRVPVALLNRIRDLGETFQKE